MTSQRFSSAGLFALALAIALVLAPRTIANAQSQQAASGRGLGGTWRVEVTLRDCNTGAPLGSPFRSLLSFARGGTMTETTARFSPALRGPGQGYSDVTIRVAKGDRNKDSTAGLFVWRA